ncbi:Spc7 kinetochore protein [Nakaseomyces glabratus]
MKKSILKGSPTKIIRSEAETPDHNEGNESNKSNILQSQITQRVSFLPDVTLHSFDISPTKNMATSTQKPAYENDGNASMDLTEPISLEVQAGASTTEPKEETMEFTAPQNINNVENTLTAQLHSERTRKSQSELDLSTDIISQAMEMTQVLPNETNNLRKANNDANDAENEDGMEFTQIVPNIHEYSVKRRRLNDDTIEKLVSPATPPDNTSEQQIYGSDSEIIEKMSPIKIIYATEQRPASVPKQLFDDKEPNLQSPHKSENHENEKTITHSFSLKNFLSDIDYRLLENIKDIFKQKNTAITLNTLDYSIQQNLRLGQVNSVYHIDVPTWEIKTFIINELRARINQSKSMDVLENDISKTLNINSIALKYTSQSEAGIDTSLKTILAVKEFSEMETQRDWYEWRLKQLDGFREVLTDNLEILNEEYTNVKFELQKVKELKFKISDLKDTLQREIRILTEVSYEKQKNGPSLDDKIKFAKIKKTLLHHQIEVNKHDEIQRKRQQLEDDINSKTKQLIEINQSISKVTSKRKTINPMDIKKERTLLANFNLLQALSNIGCIRNSNDIIVLEFKLLGGMKILIDNSIISANEPSGITLSPEFQREPLFRYLFEEIMKEIQVKVKQNKKGNLFEMLISKVIDYIPIYNSFHLFSLIFNVKYEMENEVSKNLKISDIDYYSNANISYTIPINDILKCCRNNNSILSIKVRSESKISHDRVIKRITEKGSRIFPWLNNTNINLEIL